MGQAGRAPDASYQRKYNVSRHALDRFRQRVEEEFTASSDHELGNLLDERVRRSVDRSTVSDSDAPNVDTWIIKIESRSGSVDYAIVRENTVVTVLDDHMLQVNYDSGRWKRGPMNSSFRDVLGGLKLPPKEIVTLPPVTVVNMNDPIAAAGIAIAMTSLAYHDAVDAVEDARLAFLAAEKAVADADFRKDQAAAHLVQLITERKKPK